MVVGKSGGPFPLLLLLGWCEAKDVIVVVGKEPLLLLLGWCEAKDVMVVGKSGGPFPLLLLLGWCEAKDVIVVVGKEPLLLLLGWCEAKDVIVVVGKDLPEGGGWFHPQLRAQGLSAMFLRLALKILKLFTLHNTHKAVLKIFLCV
jgi:hypothetical protein